MIKEVEYFETIRNASRDVWKIVINLLEKNIEIDVILQLFNLKREELEEIDSLLKEREKTELTRIAISLARDATILGLTVQVIEDKTGVNRSEFIDYMDKGEG